MVNQGVLPFWRKLLYGVPDFANGLLLYTKQGIIVYFFNIVLGLDLWLCVTAIASAILWDAVSDPLVGKLSDGTRSRLGRRRLYMLLGAVLVTPAVVSMFSATTTMSLEFESDASKDALLFVWMLITSIILRTTLTIIVVPYQALGAEISPTYADRTSITGIRIFFQVLGILAGQAVPLILFFTPRFEGDRAPYSNPEPYLEYAAFIGLLAALAILVGFFGMRRMDNTSVSQERPGLKSFFVEAWESLRNRPFFIVLLCMLFAYVGLGLIQALQVYLLQYAMGYGENLHQLLIGGTLFGVAALAAPIWFFLNRKFEKQTLFAAASIIFIGFHLFFGFTAGPGNLIEPGAQSLPLGVLVAVGIGLGLSGMLAIPPSMVADIVARDTIVNKRQREGTYFGVLTFANKLAIATSFVLMAILFAIIGFQEPPGGVDQNSPEYAAWEEALKADEPVQDGIRKVFGFAPAAVAAIALIIMLFYRLDRASMQALERERDAAPNST